MLPFADILAWCLMPNHFHLMVHVNRVELTPSPTQSRTRSEFEVIPSLASSRTLSELEIIPSPTQSRTRNNQRDDETMSFNKSIGIMLASYTRAVNKQQNWSGSLFRSETKALA